ncbi:MAG: NAD(P)-dependent oxidoreductase [Gammaproteobacteria bacterium]|nr:NAD(P)-dependent oxidoreductase [Gammaproteobacteria bacterium]
MTATKVDDSPPLPIGFIGLGQMGGGMALNLANADVPLTVFDIDSTAMQPLRKAGANAAQDAATVARQSALVFLCLPYVDEVEQVLFDPGGVLVGAHQSLQVVDASTLNYYATLSIAQRVAEAGVAYSDCPVSGMPKKARAGTLTMMFGGNNAAFTAAQPYLRIMGETIIHCGALGCGQMMKAFNNVILDINIAAFCELLPLAVKAGLDAGQIAEVVMNGSSRSFASEHFVPKILTGQFDNDYSMRDAYKDIVNVEEIAARNDASIPLMEAMHRIYREAMEKGFGQQPKSAMIKLYEAQLALQVRRDTTRRSQ